MLDPHCCGQLIDAGLFEAAIPEQHHRGFQCMVSIESLSAACCVMHFLYAVIEHTSKKVARVRIETSNALIYSVTFVLKQDLRCTKRAASAFAALETTCWHLLGESHRERYC